MTRTQITDAESDALDLMMIVMGLAPTTVSMHDSMSTLLMLPGDIQTHRVGNQWVGLADTVLVAGQREQPGLSFDDVRRRIVSTVEQGSVPIDSWPETIRTTEFANHTAEQMQWTVAQLKELGQSKSRRLIVSTSSYHVARCALTFVKHWQRSDPDWYPRLCVLPTIDRQDPLNSFATKSPDTNNATWGEVIRLIAYDQDVANREEFLEYYQASGMGH